MQSRCFTLAYNRCFTLHKKMWKNMTWTVTYQIATQISSASAQMDVMLQLLSQVLVPLQSDASTSQNLHSWGSRIGLYKGYIPSRIKRKQGHLLKEFTLLFNISDPMLHLLALSSALRDQKSARWNAGCFCYQIYRLLALLSAFQCPVWTRFRLQLPCQVPETLT